MAPWQDGVSFDDLTAYQVAQNAEGQYRLQGITAAGAPVALQDPAKFCGFNLDDAGQLSAFFLENNGLKIEVQLYEGGTIHPEIGQFRDLIVESAVTNIVDFEDAVAIVDADDMVVGLRNYLGLMRGDLQAHGL